MEAACVEDVPDLPGVVRKVAAVEPHALDANALGAQPRRERHRLLGRRLGVVRVQQEDDVIRQIAGVTKKRLGLVVVRLHEGMRHRAVHRDAEAQVRQDGRGARHPRQVGGARREETGLRAMGTAQPEVDQELAGRDEHGARRFRGDERLEVEEVHEPRLHELGLGDGGRHPHDRLVGEENRALRHGVHVAREAERRKVIDEGRIEAPAAPHPVELLGVEAESLEVLDELLEARRHQEVTSGRQLPHEQLEDRRRLHAVAEVAVQHGQLVEVCEQRTRFEPDHPGTLLRAA